MRHFGKNRSLIPGAGNRRELGTGIRFMDMEIIGFLGAVRVAIQLKCVTLNQQSRRTDLPCRPTGESAGIGTELLLAALFQREKQTKARNLTINRK